MVLLPVGTDLRVIFRRPDIDALNRIGQARLREQGVNSPVEYERVLIVDGDIDRDPEPVNPRMLRWRQGVWPFKHCNSQLDEGESEKGGKNAHQQVGTLKGEIEVGSPPGADSSADDQDEPGGNARSAETDSGDVVDVGHRSRHRSPRPLRRRQNSRIATVSAAVATPATMIPHVPPLTTAPIKHTSRLSGLPSHKQTFW